MMPTNEEAVSKLATVISTHIFEKKGKQIADFIKSNPVSGEHPYESAFRLGLAVLLMELLAEQKEK